MIFQEKSRQEDEIRRRMMEEEGKCGAVKEVLVLEPRHGISNNVAF